MKACLICWKKAKGKTQKCIVVVKGLQKDWDRFYSKEMCPSFSSKKEKKKWSYYLKPPNMQERSLQGKPQRVGEDNNWSIKRSAKR